MAGTLLHVTLAERIAASPALGSPARELLAAHPNELALGAVLVDLPYYRRLWLTGLGMALGREPDFGGPGETVHATGTAAFARALIDHATGDAGRALALGHLTHHAVDLVFHAEIERRIRPAVEHGEPRGRAHKRLEDELDLHVHCDLLGHPGIGTAYARRALAPRPFPEWTRQVRAAWRSVHGRAPRTIDLALWLGWLRAFGAASSVGWVPWVRTLARDDSALAATAIALAERAVAEGVTMVGAGFDYATGRIDAAAISEAVPDRSLLEP
ncbi:MAG TPA: zinc dependent phospholipase C family protein [Polyangia bacterium]|nr:zinc dependent phospholipase C family protein [Polyangia bacterium]